VLLDEIEKAHPDVFNILLQVLDDGRLTDNKGRLVDFKNTIIIMTSNVPEEDLRSHFRPEFLNRIDDIIVFKQLTEDQIVKVVAMQFNHVKDMLKANGIDIDMTDKAMQYIGKISYDPQYGARPVKRMMQREMLNELSRMIIADKVNKDKPITVDYDGNGLVFRN
jgi:ATPases with chaperone activity, ATP-binding subunit